MRLTPRGIIIVGGSIVLLILVVVGIATSGNGGAKTSGTDGANVSQFYQEAQKANVSYTFGYHGDATPPGGNTPITIINASAISQVDPVTLNNLVLTVSNYIESISGVSGGTATVVNGHTNCKSSTDCTFDLYIDSPELLLGVKLSGSSDLPTINVTQILNKGEVTR